jgi:hypothetical protein
MISLRSGFLLAHYYARHVIRLEKEVVIKTSPGTNRTLLIYRVISRRIIQAVK